MNESELGGTSEAVDEAWARRLVLVLVATWLVAAAIALLSFRVEWGRWPPLWDAVLGLTLLAPLAMPMSFVQLLGARNVWRGVKMLLIVVTYWGTVTALLVYAFRRRSRLALVVVVAISPLAAFRWLHLAGGIMGI